MHSSGAVRPIGVFDSGVGGLSVLRELRRELPSEHFVYFADSAHCPYGERADEDIRDLTSRAVRWLASRGTKAAVVACNTASAFSLTALRAEAGDAYPVVGLVPAVKPAVEGTRSGVVGVLATPGTLRGTLLRDVIERFAAPRSVRVLTSVSTALVPLVEAGLADSPEARAELRGVLAPLADAGADQLVLGCTHYPFLAPAIRAEFGERFALLDSGAAVARRVRAVLAERDLLYGEGREGRVECFTSGNAAEVSRVASRLLGKTVAMRAVTASGHAA